MHKLQNALSKCFTPHEQGDMKASAVCMEDAVFTHMKFPPSVLEYFSLRPPATGDGAKVLTRFRLPSCDEPHFNYPLVHRVAMLWKTTQQGPCLWANMLPSELALIISLAKAFMVTHVLECGRMGGLPLLHYTHFGFNVTSFEVSPQPAVKAALSELVPAVRQIDDDCIKGIPLLADDITRADPTARVAVVFDGPKGYGVFQVANKLAEKVAFIVVDDQTPGMLALKGNKGVQPRWPTLVVGPSSRWNQWMPLSNMMGALNAGEKATPRPSKAPKEGARLRFNTKSPVLDPFAHSSEGFLGQMIMLGGKWRQER